MNHANLPCIGKTMKVKRGKYRNFEGEVVGLQGGNVRLTDGVSWVYTSASNLLDVAQRPQENPNLGDFVKIRFTNHRFEGRYGVVKIISSTNVLVQFSDDKNPLEGWVHVNDLDSTSEVKVRGMLRG